MIKLKPTATAAVAEEPFCASHSNSDGRSIHYWLSLARPDISDIKGNFEIGGTSYRRDRDALAGRMSAVPKEDLKNLRQLF